MKNKKTKMNCFHLPQDLTFSCSFPGLKQKHKRPLTKHQIPFESSV